MNIEYKIEPYKSVGEYSFGMTRDDIRKFMGEPISTVNYGYPISDRYLDDYGFLYILCSNKGRLEAVQIFPDYTEDNIFLICNGKKIELTTDFEKTISDFLTISDDFVKEDDTYLSEKLGVKIFCPDDYVENVIIHDMHCYDE